LLTAGCQFVGTQNNQIVQYYLWK